MLRASAHATATPFDLRGIVDTAIDVLVDAGAELIEFTTALIKGDDARLSAARARLQARLGPGAVTRAAAVAGNFQMMNRLVDATGVPVGASLLAIAPDLGLAPDQLPPRNRLFD